MLFIDCRAPIQIYSIKVNSIILYKLIPDFSNKSESISVHFGSYETQSSENIYELKDKYPNFEVGLKCILMVNPYLLVCSYIK